MKSLFNAWLSAFAVIAAALSLCAQDTPKQSLLVLSKRDLTLAIVDPGSMKVVGKVSVGEDPHEVIASTDGKTAYVSDYGGGRLHTLSVVDLAAQKALPPIDLGPLGGPHGLTFLDGKVWFTAEGAKVIGRYDPAAQKVDWVLGTGQNRTHMIFVSPDMKRIVTTNVSSGTVSIFEKALPTNPWGGPPPKRPGTGPRPANMPARPPFGQPQAPDWNQTVVKVGNGSEGFDISPDGSEIWVANSQDGTISVIDSKAKAVAQTLAANVPGANRLKFTLDGRLVLVSMLGSGDLAVFDAASRKAVKRVPIGSGAAGILMEPGGARAFVACTPDNYVAVIDLKTLTVSSRINAGPEPDGMAWASAN